MTVTPKNFITNGSSPPPVLPAYQSTVTDPCIAYNASTADSLSLPRPYHLLGTVDVENHLTSQGFEESALAEKLCTSRPYLLIVRGLLKHPPSIVVQGVP